MTKVSLINDLYQTIYIFNEDERWINLRIYVSKLFGDQFALAFGVCICLICPIMFFWQNLLYGIFINYSVINSRGMREIIGQTCYDAVFRISRNISVKFWTSKEKTIWYSLKVDRLDPGIYKCLFVKSEIQFCSMSQFIYGYEQLFMRNRRATASPI